MFFNEIGCKKFSNFVFNEIDCKKLFYSQFHWKKFRKFLIVNFRLWKNVLLLNSLQKKFENFLQSISLKEHFEIFLENPKKTFLAEKKKGGAKNAPFFSSKIRHDLSLGFDVCMMISIPNKQTENWRQARFLNNLLSPPNFANFSQFDKNYTHQLLERYTVSSSIFSSTGASTGDSGCGFGTTWATSSCRTTKKWSTLKLEKISNI